MKISALPVAVLFVVSMVSAPSQTPAAPAAPDAKAAPTDITITDPKKAPAAKQADPKAPVAKKDDKKKKEEPMGTIAGKSLARPNGTWLGLEIKEGNFVLTFYNAKKKPMAVDVTRGTARWPNLKSIHGDNNTVLNVSGTALVGAKPVLPPYTFIVRITLLQGDGDAAKAVENYTVQFSG